jgi:hypothetical protein
MYINGSAPQDALGVGEEEVDVDFTETLAEARAVPVALGSGVHVAGS